MKILLLIIFLTSCTTIRDIIDKEEKEKTRQLTTQELLQKVYSDGYKSGYYAGYRDCLRHGGIVTNKP